MRRIFDRHFNLSRLDSPFHNPIILLSVVVDSMYKITIRFFVRAMFGGEHSQRFWIRLEINDSSSGLWQFTSGSALLDKECSMLCYSLLSILCIVINGSDKLI